MLVAINVYHNYCHAFILCNRLVLSIEFFYMNVEINYSVRMRKGVKGGTRADRQVGPSRAHVCLGDKRPSLGRWFNVKH